MGCGPWTRRCDGDEKPVHEVCVDGFWMGRYEVTNAQFVKFLNEIRKEVKLDANGDVVFYKGHEIFDVYCGSSKGGCSPFQEMIENVGTREDPRFVVVSGYEDHPVVLVSWYGTKAFAEWLSRKTGYRFRLPTEAEWEYACRSGGRKVKYAWGNGDPYVDGRKAANVADETAKWVFKDWTIWEGYDDGYVYTAPMGSFAPNGLGLYDMSGNVWEWCEDWYDGDYYARSPRRNPKGPAEGKKCVLRGGGWFSIPSDPRCAQRYVIRPDGQAADRGFRLVRLSGGP